MSFSLRFAALIVLPMLGGCIYTTHRTMPAESEVVRAGRPMQWSEQEQGYVFHQSVETSYQRRSVYPAGFRFLTGDFAPVEPLLRFPTYLLEMPCAWDSKFLYDVMVIDRMPRRSAVTIRPMPYYDLPVWERYGARIAKAFADPMFLAYRRIFEKEIDFEKGNAALAAENGGYAPQRLYLRTYERWLADHVPLLAWEDSAGGENLLLRREKGLDHYRNLKLVRSIGGTLPPDAVYDTVDGENILVFSRGWANNSYWQAIPTSKKGGCIVTVLNLTSGEQTEFGRYADVPVAGDLPEDLDVRIEKRVVDRRGLFASKLW